MSTGAPAAPVAPTGDTATWPLSKCAVNTQEPVGCTEMCVTDAM